jgi:hypothetical protein
MSNTLCFYRNMTLVAVSRNRSCMMAHQLLVKSQVEILLKFYISQFMKYNTWKLSMETKREKKGTKLTVHFF